MVRTQTKIPDSFVVHSRRYGSVENLEWKIYVVFFQVSNLHPTITGRHIRQNFVFYRSTFDDPSAAYQQYWKRHAARPINNILAPAKIHRVHVSTVPQQQLPSSL
jgi:hypothetical protein